jgi:hypothetical protein
MLMRHCATEEGIEGFDGIALHWMSQSPYCLLAALNVKELVVPPLALEKTACRLLSHVP